MERQVYCISGLGADFRIFSKLRLQNAVLHPITWQMPAPGETLPAYARRLSGQIVHENAVVLGVSFGGMLTSEIAALRQDITPILISSCKSSAELPLYMRAAGAMRLHKALPYHLVTRSTVLNRFIFDTRSHEEELYLKQMMLRETGALFIRRSVDMILRWNRTRPVEGLVHIHGSADKLLLPGPVKATHWLQGGGHFMVWNMADAVSEIINNVLRRPSLRT